MRKPGAADGYPIVEELEETNAQLKAEVQELAGYIAWLETQWRTRDGRHPKPSAPVAQVRLRILTDAQLLGPMEKGLP